MAIENENVTARQPDDADNDPFRESDYDNLIASGFSPTRAQFEARLMYNKDDEEPGNILVLWQSSGSPTCARRRRARYARCTLVVIGFASCALADFVSAPPFT